jgi:alpha-methylacyl-CoA racemase
MAERIGLDARFIKGQHDRKLWPEMRAEMTRLLRGKTRDEWCRLLEGSDACFAPVLSIAEAPQHPHAKARQAFVDVDGVVQPGPAPRFDRSTPEPVRPAPATGAHTDEVLAEAGFSADEIAALHAAGAARRA